MCGAGDVGESEFVDVEGRDSLWGVHESSSRGPGRGRERAARPLIYFTVLHQYEGPKRALLHDPLSDEGTARRARRGTSGGS